MTGLENIGAISLNLENHAALCYTNREPLSRARASGMHPDNIEAFYQMYYDTLVKYNLLHMPWLIFNVDETGLQACQGSSKVYHRADSKHPYSLTANSTKAVYTVSFCTSATGQ